MTIPRGHWGRQTDLFQRDMPAFWLYLLLLGICGLAVGALQAVYAATQPGPWALSWGLLVLFIVPVVLVVRWLDLYEREPRSLVVGAFLWGATVAVTFASFANVSWGTAIARLAGGEFAAQWSAALTAPIVEESYKVIGVIVLYLIAREEFDDLMDGFVIGAMVGLGFAVVEDVDYFLGAFGGSVGGVLEGFWTRVIASGLYGHVLYTGLSGIGVAYFATRTDVPRRRRLAVAIGLLLTAMAAHFAWNSPLVWELPLLVATTIKGLPFLIVLVIVLRLARRREDRWLAAALESEVGRPGLTAEELDALRDPPHRKRATRAVRKASGRAAAGLFKRFQRKQMDLSMVATRVDRSDDPQLVRQRSDLRALRKRLWAIPGVIGALGIPATTVERVRQLPPEIAWAPDVAAPHPGLPWWSRPGTSRPPDGRVDPAVQLMAGQRQGDWAEVRAGNGWTGWVDGRLLAPIRRTYWR